MVYRGRVIENGKQEDGASNVVGDVGNTGTNTAGSSEAAVHTLTVLMIFQMQAII